MDRATSSAPGRAWSSAAALTHQGRLRGMDGESASRVLAAALVQELLRSSPLALLAYAGRDGYARVMPTGYVCKGGKFVVCTPDNAPKVRSLGSNPRVALTIDTQTQPPRILLVRGTASMEFIDGVPDDYLEASHRYRPFRQSEQTLQSRSISHRLAYVTLELGPPRGPGGGTLFHQSWRDIKGPTTREARVPDLGRQRACG